MPSGSVVLQPLQGKATACETASLATSGDGSATGTAGSNEPSLVFKNRIQQNTAGFLHDY